MIGLLGLLLMLALVSLLPIGIVLIVRSGKGRLPYPSCGHCGYDLTGFSTDSDACPECGGRYVEVGIIPAQPGRRKGMLAWGIALVILPLVLGTMIVGTGVMLAARSQAAAVQARQQAQLALIGQNAILLAVELAAVKEEREQTTDLAAADALDATIVELTNQLNAAESELKALQQQQGGD